MSGRGVASQACRMREPLDAAVLGTCSTTSTQWQTHRVHDRSYDLCGAGPLLPLASSGRAHASGRSRGSLRSRAPRPATGTNIQQRTHGSREDSTVLQGVMNACMCGRVACHLRAVPPVHARVAHHAALLTQSPSDLPLLSHLVRLLLRAPCEVKPKGCKTSGRVRVVRRHPLLLPGSSCQKGTVRLKWEQTP